MKTDVIRRHIGQAGPSKTPATKEEPKALLKGNSNGSPGSSGSSKSKFVCFVVRVCVTVNQCMGLT